MQIVEARVATLIADPNNARTHSERNIKAIASSLKMFGQQKPIVVNKDNVVIAGSGTLAAAHSLGMQTIQIVVSDLVGEEATAFAIADNRTAELAAWDEEVLSRTLLELKESIDLESLGFDESFFNVFGNNNDAPEVDVPSEFLIVVECVDENQQRELFEELQAKEVKCKIIM